MLDVVIGLYVLWHKYKKARNEVTAALRKAKASYFTKMFEEVKKSSAYLNLINRARSCTKHKSTIGPIRRNDGSLALSDKEKVQLINSYFATIENLTSTLPAISDNSQMQITKQDDLSELSTTSITPITISERFVQEKINKLKAKKSTGSDGISPKLLKLAGNTIVPALVDTYNYSINRRVVFSLWKMARLTPISKKDDKTDDRLR
ncbi:uncharacterized protein [Montipora foliosa]|uniref:uncharacterized protein n=1 Tax=Montipora foliosa TaxID=591990 RepID=UPI0035F1F23E